MLTPEQVVALRDAAGQIADPINLFLIEDIARRIASAGQLTSTAAYQVWRAQQLGISQREIKKRLEKILNKSQKEIEALLTQSAEVGYDFDIKHLPYSHPLPFEHNTVVQQIVDAAVKLAQDDFTNLTQTLGMVDPHGKALPLQDAYRSATDFAFQQVFTGATDYNTAIRRATKNIANKGVQMIDYESGVHTSLEAAVRRNIMGGLGLMQEQIAQNNHDELGANGWEISAHAASAPDHEPIQGRQYSDTAYETLNNSLVRRIGTLNCGHVAFPIILGVSSPQYSVEQLRTFREKNTKGVTYQGKHYTLYEATQVQRKLERSIRLQKRRILVSETTGDEDKLLTERIRLVRLNDEYSRFSKAVDLPTQRERAKVVGFGRGQAVRATVANAKVEKLANSLYDTGSTATNIKAYQRDQKLRRKIQSDAQNKIIDSGKQGKHIKGHNNFIAGRSYLTITDEDIQKLVDRYAGTGELRRDSSGRWVNKEFVVHETPIGFWHDMDKDEDRETRRFVIHYSKSGVHIVPVREVE